MPVRSVGWWLASLEAFSGQRSSLNGLAPFVLFRFGDLVTKKKKNSKSTTAKNLESKFDRGESVLDYFREEPVAKRVNLDIPAWAIQVIDSEANRRGMARQQLLKHWIIDKVDAIKKSG